VPNNSIRSECVMTHKAEETYFAPWINIIELYYSFIVLMHIYLLVPVYLVFCCIYFVLGNMCARGTLHFVAHPMCARCFSSPTNNHSISTLRRYRALSNLLSPSTPKSQTSQQAEDRQRHIDKRGKGLFVNTRWLLLTLYIVIGE
jgi:hypothetical protein